MKLLEPLSVLERIHRLPESVVLVRDERLPSDQTMERLMHELFSRVM